MELWSWRYLVLLLCLGDLLVSVSGAGVVKLEAKPPTVDYLDTNTLTVNCTYKRDDNNSDNSGKDRLLYLIISRQRPGKASQELVRINQESRLHYPDPKTLSEPIFNGVLSQDANTISYLSVTWTEISEDLTGTYVCEVHSLTEKGYYVSYFDTVDVLGLEERKLSSKLFKEVKALKSELKIMESFSTNFNTEIQKWKQDVSLTISLLLEKCNIMFQASEVYRNRVYYESRIESGGVSEAEAVCRSTGGYLIEINDQKELNFVKSMRVKNQGIYKHFFISGRKNVTDRKYYWPRTNQLVSFFKWSPGEPNGLYGGDPCIEYNDNESLDMNDLPCRYGKRAFICEVPLS